MGSDDICSWDDAKQMTNLLKHIIDFADIYVVFDGRFVVTAEDKRKDYGEVRYNMLVEFNGAIISVTFTPRSGKAHLISVRPASREERKVYNAKRKNV